MARSRSRTGFNGRTDFFHRALGKTFVDYEHEVVLKIGDASWTRQELATKLGCCHLSAARRLGKHLEEYGIDSVNKLHATAPEELLALKGLGTIQVFVVMCVLDAEKFNAEKWYGFDADTVTTTTLINRAKAAARAAGPKLPETESVSGVTAADQFGMAVRLYRRSRGFTQRQLAKHVGYNSASYISNIERGRKNLTLAQCEKFAHALKRPLYAFFYSHEEVIRARASRPTPPR